MFDLKGLSSLGQLAGARRSVLWTVFLFSAALNILALSGSFFMLLVYDEVLPGRSGATLIGLVILVIIAYIFMGLLDLFRSRVMAQLAALIDRTLSTRVFDIVSQYSLKAGDTPEGMQPLRDLDQIRSWFAGPGPLALFDLPWVVLYIAILFIFHYSLGFLTLIGAGILILLLVVSMRMTADQSKELTRMTASRYAIAESSRRNAEVLRAMGMAGTAKKRWEEVSEEFLSSNTNLNDRSGNILITSKIFRQFLQSMILAVGAWLVINDQASPGVIIASSIISSRALAPIEQTIAQWRPFVAAQQGWRRLEEMLMAFPAEAHRTSLPRPTQTLALENVTTGPPGARKVTAQDVSFGLKAGQVLGVVGPSGSGKSSLIRAIVGVWPILRGTVRIDGAASDQWLADELGPHIGFLPQDVELFDGTVAQNIGRFLQNATSEEIIAASQKAGIHDLILRLPNGYDTIIGANGSNLSAGQRQRVALARALFRNPFLIVLDEPNSNLDTEGEVALAKAIAEAKRAGSVVIVVAHRPSALGDADLLLFLIDGQVRAYGPRDEVLPKLLPQGADTQARSAPKQANGQRNAAPENSSQSGASDIVSRNAPVINKDSAGNSPTGTVQSSLKAGQMKKSEDKK